jgi:uncharacterized protein (DUF1330 family)
VRAFFTTANSETSAGQMLPSIKTALARHAGLPLPPALQAHAGVRLGVRPLEVGRKNADAHPGRDPRVDRVAKVCYKSPTDRNRQCLTAVMQICRSQPAAELTHVASDEREIAMPTYVIATVEITDPHGFEEYRKMVPATIEHYGGRFIVRGGKMETLEGDWEPKRLVIIEFDSLERAKQWWASEEYRDAKALRHRTAKTDLIVVEGA